MKNYILSWLQALLILTFSQSIMCYANEEIREETNEENTVLSEAIISKEDLLNRGLVPHDHFVLNSIPKCGTHFIMNCIYYMINKHIDEGFDYDSRENFLPHVKVYADKLKTLEGMHYIHKTHVPYFQELEAALLSVNCKWIFFIRDPRDALVSLVFYLENFRGNVRDFMFIDSQIYDHLSFDEKLDAVMTGSCCTNYLEVFYKPLMKWVQSSYGLTIKFEDLVGPDGGGTKEKQEDAIKKMAHYLNVKLSEEEIQAIATYIFVKQEPQKALGLVYQRSQIGSWKMFFNESNKQLFEKIFSEEELAEIGYEMKGEDSGWRWRWGWRWWAWIWNLKDKES